MSVPLAQLARVRSVRGPAMMDHSHQQCYPRECEDAYACCHQAATTGRITMSRCVKPVKPGLLAYLAAKKVLEKGALCSMQCTRARAG